MSSRQNRQVVLKSRPVGIPQSEHFEIVNTPLPELQPGELLVRNDYLSVDPAMRGRVSAVNSIFIGASNQLGEFESGATAAAFGPVGSVVLGGVGTLVVAGLWMKLFPDLAKRERLRGGASQVGVGRR